MTTAAGHQIVPHQPVIPPRALRAADQGVADVPGVRSLRQHPPRLRDPVAHLRRLVRRGRARVPAGAAAHRGPLPGRPRQFRRQPLPPCAWPRQGHLEGSRVGEVGVPLSGPGRARLFERDWDRRLSKPQRQAGALTADVLAVIRLTAVQPRLRGRGFETPEQAAERGKFDVALVVVHCPMAGLRRSEASSLTWGDVQRWDDGSGRITVVRSKTDAGGYRAPWWPSPPPPWRRSGCNPAGRRWWRGEGVRAVGVTDRPSGEGHRQSRGVWPNWELFSGHSGRVGMARRMAQNGAPTHEIERQGRWKQSGGMVGRYTRGETAGSALRYF